MVPIEAQKPFETVYELKNEVPSFEEFMKTYENDGNVNYDDLSVGDVSEVRGYGPCTDGRRYCSCSQGELERQSRDNVSSIYIQNNIYNIWIYRWPGTTPPTISGSRRGFRFETYSQDRTGFWGDLFDSYRYDKYLERKPTDYGGGSEQTRFLREIARGMK